MAIKQMQQHDLNNYLKAVGVGVLSLLCVFLIVLTMNQIKMYPSIGEGDAAEMSHTISVTGHAEISAVPDTATFTWTVTENGKTVDEAQSKAATKSNKAIAYLKDQGIAAADIKNQYYNTSEDYSNTPNCVINISADTSANGSFTYKAMGAPAGAPSMKAIPMPPSILPCPPKSSGYVTNQTVEVTLHGVTEGDLRIGQLIAGVGTFGVKATGASFSINDPETVKAQARTKAITNARQQAADIASALGVRLNKVVSFNENYGGYYPMAEKSMAMDAGGGSIAPQVPVGQQKVSDDVNVTYSIR